MSSTSYANAYRDIEFRAHPEKYTIGLKSYTITAPKTATETVH